MIARTLLALWALALVLGPPRAGSAADGLHLVLTPSQKPTDLLATGEEFGKVLAGARRHAGAGDRRLRLRRGDRGAAQPDRGPRVRAPGRLRPGQPRGQGDDRRQEPLARQELVHLAHLRAQGLGHHDAGGPARQDDRVHRSGQLLGLHLPDGAPDPARPREEPRSEDVLPRGRLRRLARRRHARPAQRPRRRARLVRHGPRAVPHRSGRARADRLRGGDARRSRRRASRRATGWIRRSSRRCGRRSCRSARRRTRRLLKRLYEIDGFAPADDRDYDPVRAAIELLGARPR